AAHQDLSLIPGLSRRSRIAAFALRPASLSRRSRSASRAVSRALPTTSLSRRSCRPALALRPVSPSRRSRSAASALRPVSLVRMSSRAARALRPASARCPPRSHPTSLAHQSRACCSSPAIVDLLHALSHAPVTRYNVIPGQATRPRYRPGPAGWMPARITSTTWSMKMPVIGRWPSSRRCSAAPKNRSRITSRSTDAGISPRPMARSSMIRCWVRSGSSTRSRQAPVGEQFDGGGEDRAVRFGAARPSPLRTRVRGSGSGSGSGRRNIPAHRPVLLSGIPKRSVTYLIGIMPPTTPATPAPAPPPARRRPLQLALILVAAFMVVLDFSIVNVALPSIERELHMPSAAVQWVVTGYAISFGGLLILGGRAADLLGRRRLFVAGLIAFSLASLAGRLAQDPVLLIAARVAQGAGAAIVAPAALSLITTGFPEGPERTRAIGLYGSV